MKPKHPFHHIPLALLGVPLLILNPAAHALGQDNNELTAQLTVAEQTEREEGNARSAIEAEKRAKQAENRANEAAEHGQKTAERAKDPSNRGTQRANEASEFGKETAENPKQADPIVEVDQTEELEGSGISAKESAQTGKELAKETAERAEDAAQEAKQTAKDAKEADKLVENEQTQEAKGNARDANEIATRAKERARDTAALAKEAAQHGEETAELAKEAAEEKKQLAEQTLDDTKSPTLGEAAEVDQQLTVDEPENATEPIAQDEIKPRNNDDVLPTKEETPELAAEDSQERETVEITASEPERLAETEVTDVTREVQAELDQRKTRIEGREQAQALINDILGAESRISRAESAREERFRPRFERQRTNGGDRLVEVSPDQRRAATTYYQERLYGREVEGPAPEFFRLSDQRGDINTARIVEQNEYVRPRYLNDGRRYVHYDSRASIPAVLMAAQTLNQVRFQPTQEIAPIFYERQNASAPHAMPLPPQNYRSDDSLVVSYPVDEKSMISSQDILFLQGSTQFSDPYSYEVVSVMADAMKAMPEEERFVIEGHASAEGSYEDNMVLSQQRAEHIVREIVRRGGVSPYRLLPVGYGESEARRPADAAESLRSQDRRVVVFRMKPETIAKR